MKINKGNNRVHLVMLGIGAAGGIFMAGDGLVERWSVSPGELPQNAVARVGERVITLDRYQQLLNDLATDKREPLAPGDYQFVLDRLIDEELLISRGIEMGLAVSSPSIRKALAAAVIAQVVAEVEAAVPSENDLRSLYESDPGFFSHGARFQLQWLRVPGADDFARQNAQRAHQQLSSGESIDLVIAGTGLEKVDLLPDVPLPLAKVRDYLGLELTQVVPELEPGGYSRPRLVSDSFHILFLAESRIESAPEFEQLRPLVEAEYLRRKGDEALKTYLQWLRQRSEITVGREKMGLP